MGLFEKKYCDICGDKIRLLGNRKLEDGNLCKNCEEKLSPWFSERRKSTVQQIKDQLAYRQENEKAVEAFTTSRMFGESGKLYMDDEKEKFIVLRPGQSMRDNPDVLDLSAVHACEVKVDTTKTELKTKDAEGKQISFDPPRYKYTYRFYMTVFVNHPWFDEMHFRYSGRDVVIEPPVPELVSALLKTITKDVPLKQAEPHPEQNEEYLAYVQMGEEMHAALLRTQIASPETGSQQEADIVYSSPACPYCGSTDGADEKGLCFHCGAKLD